MDFCDICQIWLVVITSAHLVWAIHESPVQKHNLFQHFFLINQLEFDKNKSYLRIQSLKNIHN